MFVENLSRRRELVQQSNVVQLCKRIAEEQLNRALRQHSKVMLRSIFNPYNVFAGVRSRMNEHLPDTYMWQGMHGRRRVGDKCRTVNKRGDTACRSTRPKSAAGTRTGVGSWRVGAVPRQ